MVCAEEIQDNQGYTKKSINKQTNKLCVCNFTAVLDCELCRPEYQTVRYQGGLEVVAILPLSLEGWDKCQDWASYPAGFNYPFTPRETNLQSMARAWGHSGPWAAAGQFAAFQK